MNGEKSKLSSLFQGSLFLIISNALIKGIDFLLLPLYTHNLSPSMLGVSDSITVFTGILLSILVMGLDSAYSAFYFDSKDSERDKKVFSSLGGVFAVVSLVPLIMCVFSGGISNLIFKTERYKNEVSVALIGVTLNLLALVYSLELRLKNRMFSFGIVTIVSSASVVLCNIFFVNILKLQEMALIMGTTISAGISLLVFMLFVRERPRRQDIEANLLRKMIQYSLPLIPSVIMSWLLARSDRFFLLHFFGDEAVGLYGMGARFVALLNVVITAFSNAYTAFAFRVQGEEDANKKYKIVFNAMTFILLLGAFSASVFGKEIITIMTDEAYHESYVIIRDMMFGQVWYALSTIVTYGIVFKKKSSYVTFSIAAGAIANFALNLVLIPRYGIKGAAITTLIGYLVSFAMAYYLSEKVYPCDYGIRRVVISFLVLYLTTVLCQEYLLLHKIIVWGGLMGVGIVAYVDLFKDLFREKIRLR